MDEEPRRRASFSEIMDMQIAKMNWEIKEQKLDRKIRSLSMARTPKLTKNINFLSTLYNRPKQ